jgi:hypothetical protein
MKSNLSKIAGASILALSLATLPAYAQTNTAPGGTGGGTTGDTNGTMTDHTQGAGTDATTTRNDDGFDWGWLGLIGLAGLAGLAGKKREEPARYRDPNAVGTTNYRE